MDDPLCNPFSCLKDASLHCFAPGPRFLKKKTTTWTVVGKRILQMLIISPTSPQRMCHNRAIHIHICTPLYICMCIYNIIYNIYNIYIYIIYIIYIIYMIYIIHIYIYIYPSQLEFRYRGKLLCGKTIYTSGHLWVENCEDRALVLEFLPACMANSRYV